MFVCFDTCATKCASFRKKAWRNVQQSADGSPHNFVHVQNTFIGVYTMHDFHLLLILD